MATRSRKDHISWNEGSRSIWLLRVGGGGAVYLTFESGGGRLIWNSQEFFSLFRALGNSFFSSGRVQTCVCMIFFSPYYTLFDSLNVLEGIFFFKITHSPYKSQIVKSPGVKYLTFPSPRWGPSSDQLLQLGLKIAIFNRRISMKLAYIIPILIEEMHPKK